MIGTTEILLICGVAMLLFGAAKLPEFAKSLGRSFGEFRKARREVDLELKGMDATTE